MSPAHDTGGDTARKRARRVGWRRAFAAALVALTVQAAGLFVPGGGERMEFALDGRVASLLAAALLSLAASVIAGAVAGPRFGWIAGLAVGLMPMTVHLAVTRSDEVVATACAAVVWALGGLLATRIAAPSPRRPRWRRRILIGSGVLAVGVLACVRSSGASAAAEREFPLTLDGLLGLLKATGDAFLLAGGYVGGAGLLLLVATAIMRRQLSALALLLPAVAYVALGVLPIGSIRPAATLPIALCSAVALAWSLANVPGAAERRKRVLLGGLVGLWGIGEASGVIEAKWNDARPVAAAALAAQRAPGDEVWICSVSGDFAPLQSIAPLPSIAPPHRSVTWSELSELMERADRGRAPPTFLWLEVAAHEPLATRAALEAAAAPLHLRFVERFETKSSAPLANARHGLDLPVVALFTSKP